MDLLEKLEQLKQKGAYAMLVKYGEDMGCDDNEVSPLDRKLEVICAPVGYLGEMKTYYKGTVKSFLDFDLNTEPTLVNNPPGDALKNAGFYYWGTERSVEIAKNKGRVFPF